MPTSSYEFLDPILLSREVPTSFFLAWNYILLHSFKRLNNDALFCVIFSFVVAKLTPKLAFYRSKQTTRKAHIDERDHKWSSNGAIEPSTLSSCFPPLCLTRLGTAKRNISRATPFYCLLLYPGPASSARRFSHYFCCGPTRFFIF